MVPTWYTPLHRFFSPMSLRPQIPFTIYLASFLFFHPHAPLVLPCSQHSSVCLTSLFWHSLPNPLTHPGNKKLTCVHQSWQDGEDQAGLHGGCVLIQTWAEGFDDRKPESSQCKGDGLLGRTSLGLVIHLLCWRNPAIIWTQTLNSDSSSSGKAGLWRPLRPSAKQEIEYWRFYLRSEDFILIIQWTEHSPFLYFLDWCPTAIVMIS